MREAAVIGCGPAGLLAAHGLVLEGWDVTILSRDTHQSPNARGAVFLHRSIPEVSSEEPDDFVSIVKLGNGQGYAQKVYRDPERETSWRKFPEGDVPAWAVSPVYDALWELYSGLVRECEITPDKARAVTEEFELVVNTAPLPALCESGCSFPSRPIWVIQGPADSPENMMVYSGDFKHPWYRFSAIFGVHAIEYANPEGLNLNAASQGIKVLPTNCECHPKIIRAGRWGSWKPGVLMHHAFERVQGVIA